MNPSGKETQSARSASPGDDRSIKFPVLSFSENLVDLVLSLEAISRCTKLGFMNGFYKGLKLVDSAGNLFRVINAQKVRALPLRFKFDDLLSLLEGNPNWQIDLIVAAPETISLGEVKKLIFHSFEKEKLRWEEMSDFEEFRDKLANTSVIGEIFALFKEYNMA